MTAQPDRIGDDRPREFGIAACGKSWARDSTGNFDTSCHDDRIEIEPCVTTVALACALRGLVGGVAPDPNKGLERTRSRPKCDS
jgi:hypothetical protein